MSGENLPTISQPICETIFVRNIKNCPQETSKQEKIKPGIHRSKFPLTVELQSDSLGNNVDETETSFFVGLERGCSLFCLTRNEFTYCLRYSNKPLAPIFSSLPYLNLSGTVPSGRGEDCDTDAEWRRDCLQPRFYQVHRICFMVPHVGRVHVLPEVTVNPEAPTLCPNIT